MAARTPVHMLTSPVDIYVDITADDVPITIEIDIDDGEIKPIPASKALVPIIKPEKALTVPHEDLPPWLDETDIWNIIRINSMACAYNAIMSQSLKCSECAVKCGHCEASIDGICVIDYSKIKNRKKDAWDILTEMVEISKDPNSTPEMLNQKLTTFKTEEE
jgi:hypothetical protein